MVTACSTACVDLVSWVRDISDTIYEVLGSSSLIVVARVDAFTVTVVLVMVSSEGSDGANRSW